MKKNALITGTVFFSVLFLSSSVFAASLEKLEQERAILEDNVSMIEGEIDDCKGTTEVTISYEDHKSNEDKEEKLSCADLKKKKRTWDRALERLVDAISREESKLYERQGQRTASTAYNRGNGGNQVLCNTYYKQYEPVSNVITSVGNIALGTLDSIFTYNTNKRRIASNERVDLTRMNNDFMLQNSVSHRNFLLGQPSSLMGGMGGYGYGMGGAYGASPYANGFQGQVGMGWGNGFGGQMGGWGQQGFGQQFGGQQFGMPGFGGQMGMGMGGQMGMGGNQFAQPINFQVPSMSNINSGINALNGYTSGISNQANWWQQQQAAAQARLDQANRYGQELRTTGQDLQALIDRYNNDAAQFNNAINFGGGSGMYGSGAYGQSFNSGFGQQQFGGQQGFGFQGGMQFNNGFPPQF